MTTLTQANRELFRRSADECFSSLDALEQSVQQRRQQSQDRWQPPQLLTPMPFDGRLDLTVGGDGDYAMNDWSFSQLCRLAGVSRDTINRLSPETASQAFRETLPSAEKPLQLLTTENTVRSIHGVAYTRLWDSELVATVREYARDFQPPQNAFNDATGLYSGEQDMFLFMIDPVGWIEVGGEAFAPGFFAWNSEVGRRSLGLSTFWFQRICQNHIVWDAIDVVEFTRKHTASVRDSLNTVRASIEALVQKRDARRDGFARVLRNAVTTKLGDTADDVEKALSKHGLGKSLIREAMKLAQDRGAFTIWTIVDALTRLSSQLVYAGDRLEADQKAASLLALAV